jgi:hypothetical protein
LLAGEPDPEAVAVASPLIQQEELRALAVVLTRAFVPPGAPRFMSRLAETLFIADLVLTQLYGAVMYLPARAVLMLTPPSERLYRFVWCTLAFMVVSKGCRNRRTTAALGFSCIALRFISPLRRAGGRCWCVKNYAAWPTGTGAGSDLLSNLCMLADRKHISLCLIASNSDNQRLYARAGFTVVRVRHWRRGTLMIRRPLAPMALPPATRHSAFLAGMGMPELLRPGKSKANLGRGYCRYSLPRRVWSTAKGVPICLGFNHPTGRASDARSSFLP